MTLPVSRSHVLTLSLLLLAACTAVQPSLPPPVVVEPAPQPQRWIRISKTAHTLTLYEAEQIRAVYPVVFGKDPVGPKLFQGDHRTPEGEYHVVEKYFHPFWSRFMMLDYPQANDEVVYAWMRTNGLVPRDGQGVRGIGFAIGIHGTEDESLNRQGINWTEGCVSLLNDDMNALYDLVPLGTRVVIER